MNNRAFADLELATAFIKECTGLQFGRADVTMWVPGTIEFRLSQRENSMWIMKCLNDKLGEHTRMDESFLAGIKRFYWDFSETRSLVLLRYMRDRGRAEPRAFLQLVDRTEV
jgi:hypothetical protein